MRRVVGEVEAAFETQGEILGVLQSALARTQQPLEFLPRWRFDLQLADSNEAF
jgi:hypothetical protein